MNDAILIGGMMAVTFSIRYIMFPLSGKIRFPDILERSLRYVPPAVLSAIIFPCVFMPDSKNLDLSLENAYLVGAVAAVTAGWFSKHLLFTIVSGMVIFFFWQWIVRLGVF